MPCDRLTGRALVISATVAVGTVLPGCLRTSVVRPASPPVGVPAASSPAASTSRPGAATISATPTALPGLAAPLAAQIPAAAQPSGIPTAAAPSRALSTAVNPPAAPAFTPEPTPLLDAAIERVEAVERIDTEPEPAVPTRAPDDTPAAAPTKAAEPVNTTIAKDPPPSTAVVPPPTAPAPAPASATPLPAPPDEPVTPPLTLPPTTWFDPAAPDADEPQSPTPQRAQPEAKSAPTSAEPERESPLALSELSLCRKVHGFGSVEPLDPTKLKAGQRLLLYCEVTGVQYQQTDNEFHSRLSSKIEIKAADDETVLWDYELGAAEDRCRHKRRDYFVNHVIELPRTLPPGSYRMRLTETDLVANKSAAGEIQIRIDP